MLSCVWRYYMEFKPPRSHVFHASEQYTSLFFTASRVRFFFSSQPEAWVLEDLLLIHKILYRICLFFGRAHLQKLCNHQKVPGINLIFSFQCFSDNKELTLFTLWTCEKYFTNSKVVLNLTRRIVYNEYRRLNRSLIFLFWRLKRNRIYIEYVR